MDTKIISTYTQQQAVEDGLLINITDTAEVKQAGFKVPVHLTAGLYEKIQVPPGMGGLQDFTGRLWDVLFLAVTEFRKKKDYITEFYVLFKNNEHTKPEKTKIWLVFNAYEGFTLMLPEEY
jgi:hypothetical protein